MCMPGERVLLNGTSRVLKKTTTSVLVAQKPRRTFLYALAFSLPAALPVERCVLAHWGWAGEKAAFLNIPS